LMNSDQKTAFDVICAHLIRDSSAVTQTNPTGQLKMMLSGEGGTGKSFLIEAVDRFTKLTFPAPKGSEHESCIIAAPTGKAALNVNGHTIEHLFNFPYLSQKNRSLSEPGVQKYYQDKFGHVQLLILDEVSMMGLSKLHKIHQILSCAKAYDQDSSSADFQSPSTHDVPQHELPLGGMHFLFCGDFYQLDPVKDTTLYSQKFKGVKDEIASEMVYKQIDTYMELKQQMRQKGRDIEEDQFRSFLSHIRKGQATEQDLAYLKDTNKYCVSLDDVSIRNLPNSETLTVTPFNGTENTYGCEQVNAYKLQQRRRNADVSCIIWAKHTYTTSYAKHGKKRKKTHPRADRNLVALMHQANDAKLQSKVTLSRGTRVMLRQNLSVADGLVNGSLGTVHSIIWPKHLQKNIRIDIDSIEKAAERNQTPPIVLVKFDSLPSHVESFTKDEQNVIPIAPQTAKIRCETGLSVTRHMVPLIQADCVTIHKSQGQSVKNLVCVLNRMKRTRGLFYVAASRTTSSKGLFLVKTACMQPALLQLSDFNGEKPDTYKSIHEEYARLDKIPHQNLQRIGERIGNRNFLADLLNMNTYMNDDDADDFLASSSNDEM